MNQIIMILLISLLVLVHEAGHFVAARLCGIRVTRFGIGMPIGPSWKIFKWGHTNFYLHAFLFGGYVSFPDDVQNEEDKNEEETLPSDSPELYENKTISQKLFVVSAGVLMNIVFAIFLIIFCASVFHKLPTSNQNLYVDNFSQNKTSNIQEAGLIKGDKILKINDIKIDSMYQLTLFAKNSKLFDDYAQNDLIEKNLEELKKLNPQIKDKILKGQKIILPKTNLENSLKLNENVLIGLERYKKDGVELNQNQINLRNEIYSKKSFIANEDCLLNNLVLALSDTYKPIKITVLRGNKELSFENIKVEKEGVFGVMLKVEEIFVSTNTFKEIIIKSFDYLYTTTSTMLKGLWQLITGKVSASDMHGVIAVVKIGGDIIASKGLLNGLLLTAMISINLAIMNFLPIPALDGGHVMFLLIEKITGKKPSKELGEKITNFFFILLIVLMVAICYNDIFALVTKKF